MNISEVFIKRPIATSLIMLGIAVIGVIAYRALPVSDLPNVDFPTLNVGAGLPGADPGTMASAVASPLERQFTSIAGIDGARRAINLQVMRQPGSNTIEVTSAISRLLPSFETQLPSSAHLSIRGDRSKNIREAFADIQWTMAVTLLLVVGVIFAFLGSGSATLIPALALPFSILGTFAVMSVLGFTLDNLSMMALILSIGVVDDAIVMLENIVRHIEKWRTGVCVGAERVARNRLRPSSR